MNRIAFLLGTLVALAPFALLSGIAAGQGRAVPEAPSVSQLESAIDAGLHWVREHQAEDGSYGTPAQTAEALALFTKCHRKYRPVDGPFYARALEHVLRHWNGTDFRSTADPLDDGRFNFLAHQVLSTIDTDGYAKEIAGAKSLLDGWPNFTPPAMIATEYVGRRATALLMVRGASGGWPAGNAALAPTLNGLETLHQAYLHGKQQAAAKKPTVPVALPPLAPATQKEIEQSIARGVAFLLSQQDAEGRWGFGGQPDPGITAMVVGAVQALPAQNRTPEISARIEKALDWLRSMQDADGAIHAGQLKNYVTSASVMALAKRNTPEDRAAIARARSFLSELQADEGESYSSEDLYYGGIGYGGDERPDLSNMQMALEALSTAGASPDDDTFRKALAFLERCQNNSETNDLRLERDGEIIVAGNDGGAGYSPGESKAGFVELADGTQVPRSYGSMTYALLKCYMFAGLPKDDPRVEGAWKWISKHYTLDVNPGFGASSDPTAAYQGLFYYFFTMSKALALYGSPAIVDAAGRSHDWRTELGGRLIAMQRPDGSWVNTNAERWYEGNPVLASAYALVTLDTIQTRIAQRTPSAPASK